MPATIRPSPLLVRISAAIALCALAAVPIPFLIAPTVGLLCVAAALAIADFIASRRDDAPRLERALPARMVRNAVAALHYKISRPNGPSALVSVLDELPAELGGDLLIEDVRVARSRTEISREVLPAQRGIHRLGPTYLMWTSRLGLFRFRIAALDGGEVSVRPPASEPQRKAALDHKSLRAELGVRPRPARGEGSEFESLREYVPGDEPRHIDWRATARRGRVVVRKFQTERRHTVVIAIDTGRLMAARVEGISKLDHAIDCGVALARASRQFGDSVAVVAFDRELRLRSRPRAGAAAIAELVDSTVKLVPSGHEPDYRVLLETLARHQKKRALIVVLTDFVEGSASRELEGHLGVLARRHCVLLVALRDRLLGELEHPDPAIGREQFYRRLALQDLAVERETALARIARFGAQTLDLDPARVTAPVLNRYLAMREGGYL